MAAGAGRKRGVGRSRTKLILFGIEIVIILIMLLVLYLVMHKSSEGPKMAELDPQVLEIHEEVKHLKEEGGTGWMRRTRPRCTRAATATAS